jgi:hypothetical protein
VCGGALRRAGILHCHLNDVEDAAAGFASVNVVIFGLAQFLKNVRKDAHTARAALFLRGFGERDAVVAFGDARVQILQILGNVYGDFFA